jgi:hypothetical protein
MGNAPANLDDAVWHAERLANEDPLRAPEIVRAIDLAVASVSGEGAKIDLAAVGQHIDRLDRYRVRYPACPEVFSGLAILHRARAIALANDGQHASALEALARARACASDLPGLDQLDRSVREMLENLQAQAAKAKATIEAARRRGQTGSLRPEGQRLMAQAELGTKPRDTFLGSGEPKLLASQRQLAFAKRVWLRAGLAPRASKWEAAAIAFVGASAAFAEAGLATDAERIERWLAVRARDALLQDVPYEALACLLRGEGSATAATAGTTGLAEEDPALNGLTAVGAKTGAPKRTVEVFPSTAVATAVSRPWDAQPWTFWLRTGANPVTKLAAVAATLLVVATVALVLREQTLGAERERALVQLAQAAADVDANTARSAIEAFRRSAAIVGEDARAPVIERVESELPAWERLRLRNAALTRLAALGDTPLVGQQAGGPSGHRGPAAMRACRDFLDALTDADVDHRTRDVRRRYSQEFLGWLSGSDDLAAEASLVEISAFERLVATAAEQER